MGSTGLIQAALLLLVVSLSVCTAAEAPLRTAEMNCDVYTDLRLGDVHGNYEGVLEVVTGIPAGTTLVLDSPMFPEHLDYVELVHKPGETSATIRTKKQLDAETFHESNGRLYYRFKCEGSKKFHMRKTNVIGTIPELAQKSYNAGISKE